MTELEKATEGFSTLKEVGKMLGKDGVDKTPQAALFWMQEGAKAGKIQRYKNKSAGYLYKTADVLEFMKPQPVE